MIIGAVRTQRDVAGGVQLGGNNKTVFVEGLISVVVGDPVTPHGRNIHRKPVMIEGSSSVFISGISACREGDSASCGHKSSGSKTVFIG